LPPNYRHEKTQKPVHRCRVAGAGVAGVACAVRDGGGVGVAGDLEMPVSPDARVAGDWTRRRRESLPASPVRVE
jgi:hypothetical protein